VEETTTTILINPHDTLRIDQSDTLVIEIGHASQEHASQEHASQELANQELANQERASSQEHEAAL
jgi:hypothetical protein